MIVTLAMCVCVCACLCACLCCQAQGLLSAEAQLQLSGAGKQSGAAGHVDPATLPAEQQLPQILELLLNQPVVSCADPRQWQ